MPERKSWRGADNLLSLHLRSHLSFKGAPLLCVGVVTTAALDTLGGVAKDSTRWA
jgi:hypothetical protein